MTVLKVPKRIYSQYAQKPKAVAWLEIVRALGEQVATGAEEVRSMLDYEKATGETLRIIGRIVGVKDLFTEKLLGAGVFAEKQNAPTEFGEEFGNQFSEWSTLERTRVNDQILRYLVRARIAKNCSICTHDEILRAINAIFPTIRAIRLEDAHDMSFSVVYTGEISSIEQSLLDEMDLIPVPQGVMFKGFEPNIGVIECLKDDEESACGDESLECVA